MKKKNTSSYDSPERLNVLVEGTKVVGDIITESNLRIDGEVRGNVVSSGKVVVGPKGVVIGDVTCNDGDIEGTTQGIIKIENLLILRASARVNGDISTFKLSVEEGGQFSGRCVMSNNELEKAINS